MCRADIIPGVIKRILGIAALLLLAATLLVWLTDASRRVVERTPAPEQVTAATPAGDAPAAIESGALRLKFATRLERQPAARAPSRSAAPAASPKTTTLDSLQTDAGVQRLLLNLLIALAAGAVLALSARSLFGRAPGVTGPATEAIDTQNFAAAQPAAATPDALPDAATADLDSARVALRQMQTDNAALQTRLQNGDDSLLELRKELAASVDERAARDAQLAQAARESEALAARLVDSESQNTEQLALLEQSQTALANLEAERNSARVSSADHEDAENELRAQFDATQAVLNERTAALTEADARLAGAQTRLAEQTRELETQHSELEKLRITAELAASRLLALTTAQESLASRDAAIDELHAELDKQHAQVATLQNQVERFADLEETLSLTESELKSSSSELLERDTLLAELEQLLADTRRELGLLATRRQQELDAAARSHATEIATLRTEKKTQLAALADDSDAQLTAVVADRDAQLAAVTESTLR